MIRAVIFDFGRVISAQKPESLFQSYERELRLTPGSINTIMFECKAWQDALLGKMTTAQYWSVIGPRLGLFSARKIKEFRMRYHADERVNPRVLDLIVRLNKMYKLAVCSNYPAGLADWLAEWRIDRLFDIVFCSGDEGVAKPDSAAFYMTLARLGVEPFEAVFIDDTAENVEAASSCGLKAVHFTDARALEEALSTILILPEREPKGGV